jgi:type IV pilus assembly protein PilV
MNKRKSHLPARGRVQRGISIVEALVALVVIAVGMLGIAGLYLSSLQASRSAKLRSQAVELAGSIADRIRSNRDAGAAYSSAAYGGNPAAQDCDTNKRCTPQELAQDDLAQWIQNIRDTLPGANNVTGTVAVIDRVRPQSDNYVITITWREANSDIDYSYVVSMNLANAL